MTNQVMTSINEKSKRKIINDRADRSAWNHFLIPIAVDRAITCHAVRMEQGCTRTRARQRAVGVVNETQLHAKGSSLGHCPTKVTSGLDMVIPHSSTDTFAPKPASQPVSQPRAGTLAFVVSRSFTHPLLFPSPVASRLECARLRLSRKPTITSELRARTTGISLITSP